MNSLIKIKQFGKLGGVIGTGIDLVTKPFRQVGSHLTNQALKKTTPGSFIDNTLRELSTKKLRLRNSMGKTKYSGRATLAAGAGGAYMYNKHKDTTANPYTY